MEGQIMHYPLQSGISMCRYLWSNRQAVHRYQKSKIAFGKYMIFITYHVIFFCNGTRSVNKSIIWHSHSQIHKPILVTESFHKSPD
jgi:hypothetical protein